MTKIEDMWVTPGPRPNGLQAAADGLWVIDAENKLNPGSGEVLDEIHEPEPELDGLTIHEGTLICCSEPNRRMCRVFM